jgi:putative transposase
MSLLEPQFKRLFLAFVGKAKRRFHFRLWDFCIMGNHIHFLIKPGKDGNLSVIMQWLKCNFAKAWNKAHNRSGHVWGERFYSRIIRGVEDFLRVREYIEENRGESSEGGACGASCGVGVWEFISPAARAV